MTRYRTEISKEWICRKLGILLDVHKKHQCKLPLPGDDTNEYVFFNHYSVREFFHLHGNTLLSSCDFIDDRGPVVYLARTCVHYLSAKEFNEISLQTTSEFVTLVQKARKPRKAIIGFTEYDVFEGVCEKLSDRFPTFKYASIGWYGHIKSRQHAEHEWDKIKILLDHEQPFMALWIRGHWESRIFKFHNILFLEGEALNVRLSNVAIELDICWLTELILAEQILEEIFIEKQIIDMVTRSPNSFQYLCVYRKDIKLPDNILVASAQSHDSRRGVQLLLEHRRAETKITEEVIEAAATNLSDNDGKELVELFLDQDDAKNLEITDKCLRIAAQKQGGRLLRLLLTRRIGKVDIVNELLQFAAGHLGSLKVMEVLLEYGGSQVKITEDLLVTAAKKGVSRLDLLLERGKHKVEITEAVIQAAVKSYKPDQTLNYLLKRANKYVKITEDILVAACESWEGPKLIKILLEERSEELAFTERVLQAALGGPKAGGVLKIILGQHSVKVDITDGVLLSTIKYSVRTIPEALFNWEAIDVMEVMLNQSHKKIQVPEAVAELAARELPRSLEMRSVSKMRCARARVTETLLKAAAENTRCGKDMVQLLLDQEKGQVKITEDVLMAVANNTSTGKEILEWMLQNLERGEILDDIGKEDGESKQWPALHLAAQSGRASALKVLLDKGSNINAQSMDLLTPLHLAAARGHYRVVKMLLKRRADVSAQNEDKWTALHFAALDNHEGVVKVLLEGGANIDERTARLSTPLHIAALYGHDGLVKVLLDGGADVDARENEHVTALHLAAQDGQEEVIKALLKGGADVDAKTPHDTTMLHIAAIKGHYKIAAMALERGTDLYILDEQGNTALHYAAREGHVTILMLLLQYGIQIDIPSSAGWTALHLAAENSHAVAVHLLNEQGANLDIQTKSGQTPLVRAIITANADTIELLVNLHADTPLVDNYGMTAITWLKALKTNDEMLSTICSNSGSGETLNKHRLKQAIAELSADLLGNRYANSARLFNELGHCFVMLGLAEYASIAFQQKIRTTSNTGITHHGVGCDGCFTSPIAGMRFVCEVCPDTDLCSSCMDAYRNGINLRHCYEHTFMKISTFNPPSHDDKTIKHCLQKNTKMFLEEGD